MRGLSSQSGSRHGRRAQDDGKDGGLVIGVAESHALSVCACRNGDAEVGTRIDMLSGLTADSG